MDSYNQTALKSARQAPARPVHEAQLERIGSLFEAAPLAMIAISREGRIALVNQRAEELFGYERADLLGQELEILVPERQREAQRAQWAAYFEAPRSRSMGAGMDLTGRRKDGTEFAVEIGLGYIETGEDPLTLALVNDITELKRATRDLERANAELLRSNAELDQFAFIASHDLQEPLRMIVSYLGLIERRYGERLDREGLEFLHYASDGASRMKAMIRDVLTISRLWLQPIGREPVPAEDIVREALGNLRAAIQESRAEIETGPLPEIRCDAGRLARVFQNLIGNAIKFHGECAPRVRISARRGGPEWIFTVGDNGIGIDPRNSERIFRIFERLHETEQYQGAGIGLTICKKIVERHGGRIWLGAHGEGELGGAVFHFSIPAEAPGAG
ncbi:MAG: sensor histidine kinase [Bryobacteraceae bacterium]